MASGTPAAPCTMLHDCNNRVPLVLASGNFQHLSSTYGDEELIKMGLENQVKPIVTLETGSISFSNTNQQKLVTSRPTRPTSQTHQKRPTSAGNEKQQSPRQQQTASACTDNQEYQEEFNRMRERLFRMLSKVPIQVETQSKAQELSTCYQETSSFASSGSSSVTCSSSTSSSVGSGHHNHQQQQHKSVIDREPLIIKYYHERSLEEILELHFGCSLIKHHQIDGPNDYLRLDTYEQPGDQQDYGPIVNHQEALSSAQAAQDQPHYQQQQFEVEVQGWQPPSAFVNHMTTADYSWRPYDTTGGFFNNNNKISSSAAISSNGNDKCNRGSGNQQSSRRTKDNIAASRRLVAGAGQVAKRVRAKRSSNSGLASQPQALASSLLQPTSNTTTDVGGQHGGQQHHQHLTSPTAAIFTATADTFHHHQLHQSGLATPNQFAGGHHHHLYAYQSPGVDTSASVEAGMLSFNQVTQGEPPFVGQGELASTSCGHHYNDDLQQLQHHQHHHQHHQQATANYYQPTAGLIYQQAQVHSADLYPPPPPPVPLELSAINEHHHHRHQFQHHQHQHHNHHQHQHQQPMIEQPDYAAGHEHPHRITFYPQAEADGANGPSYVFTPQSTSAQEASLSYSGQQPGQLEIVANGHLGPSKWPAIGQTTTTTTTHACTTLSRQSHSQ